MKEEVLRETLRESSLPLGSPSQLLRVSLGPDMEGTGLRPGVCIQVRTGNVLNSSAAGHCPSARAGPYPEGGMPSSNGCFGAASCHSRRLCPKGPGQPLPSSLHPIGACALLTPVLAKGKAEQDSCHEQQQKH